MSLSWLGDHPHVRNGLKEKSDSPTRMACHILVLCSACDLLGVGAGMWHTTLEMPSLGADQALRVRKPPPQRDDTSTAMDQNEHPPPPTKRTGYKEYSHSPPVIASPAPMSTGV